MDKQVDTNKEYFDLLDNVKNQINEFRIKASISVNTEMILMYPKIGTMILEKNVWGSKFVEMLSKDLKLAFPSHEGFSVTNLRYMQKFALNITKTKYFHRVWENYRGVQIECF